jgi:hypothetical protein
MKNILFICLLTIINALVVSCLGLGDTDKCNKFVNDYHNPAVDKYEEFARKLRSYNDMQAMKDLKHYVWGNYGHGKELSFDTYLDVDDINGLNIRNISNGASNLNNSKKNFDSLSKLADESIDAFKKIMDNDSEVCKNKFPHSNSYYGVDATGLSVKPGESDYKSKIEKIKKDIEKVVEVNKAFRAKIKNFLGI